MSLFSGDASEVFQLADDLTQVAGKTRPTARAAIGVGIKTVERAWRNDAARLHDSHAKFYADSITSEVIPSFGTIAAEVGPNEGKKQGFLGPILEFGGERSPVYLTGLNAVTRSEAATEQAIRNEMDGLF